ncbi:11286_t:CDS:2 [Paraglomus brasilianum]|uniref:11286_t:CDS:1 n=1 Tax=Paraglomus brasilianum TaxID=144538 RepID=A0A9N8VJL3_9GLOM|nr:11286_t:CDS:2 [Paraglomus brasilianum]
MTSLGKRNEERTHEENQERAYIAASHRGDRSLEARMESARKASEIHKKRTGKALRITEDDVRNEEMYQEIDEPEETRESRRHGETSKRQGGSAKK